MPPADRPYRTRPLAGVDQALGDGRAREPTELLDRLRERLDRLDPNHPSASPVEEPGSTVEEPGSTEEAASPAESAGESRPNGPSLRKEGADQSSGSRPVDQDAGAGPALDQAGEPASPPPARDQGGVVDIGLVGKGERYRPWFADEPGAPWFIE